MIAEQLEHAAVIVTDAARYRDGKTRPLVAPGTATPLIPEDVWVPQVYALAAPDRVARERNLYVALDTGQLSPRRPALHTC